MEQELGVPWEDVFETIDAQPLAAGTIAQVHRATLADHTKAVVKVQRPDAKEQIEQDLALLEVFAEKVAERPGLKSVVDMQAVFEHLSESLHRELDFRREGREHRPDGLGHQGLHQAARARRPPRLLDVAPARDAGHRRWAGELRAGGTGPQGGRAPAARVLLQADPGGRLLPRRPPPRQPDVAARGGGAVLPGPRHGGRGRPRAARTHDAAADGVLAAGRRVPDGRDAHAHGGINRSDLDVEAFQEELGA
jgi:hypothetical protein